MLFAFETYLEKCGADPFGHFDVRRHREEFEDWLAVVPVEDALVEIVCCPEDIRCQSCDRERSTKKAASGAQKITAV